ncbi:MAG: phage portal protein [Rickettsiales bacterium]|nr:phage portal protein [Rickettsiales bacterium]
MTNRFKQFFTKSSDKSVMKNRSHSSDKSYFYEMNTPHWSSREYEQFSDQAYIKNVIAHRAINMVSQAAASVPWALYKTKHKHKVKLQDHPLLKLLHRPNPFYAGAEFFENIYAYKLISGNAFIQALGRDDSPPKELHILRPDRVSIVPDGFGNVAGYIYKVKTVEKFYPCNKITGHTKILHIKNFHPLDDLRGLSSVEAAAFSIDQHNQAAAWNKSLLENAARPSGALVVKSNGAYDAVLSDEQYTRIKEQMEESFMGNKNAGKPIVMEGGLEWQEMSMSPKDMDFIESKNSAARDIALSFGVPPQLLGIPGDNTYSNMQEARLALWEETVIPMLDHLTDSLNHWLVPMYGDGLSLAYDVNEISGLSARREKIWARIENASFLTVNEKRQMIGLSPIENGDVL